MLQLHEHGVRCQELENVFSIFALQLFYIRAQSSLIGKKWVGYHFLTLTLNWESWYIQRAFADWKLKWIVEFKKEKKRRQRSVISFWCYKWYYSLHGDTQSGEHISHVVNSDRRIIISCSRCSFILYTQPTNVIYLLKVYNSTDWIFYLFILLPEQHMIIGMLHSIKIDLTCLYCWNNFSYLR